MNILFANIPPQNKALFDQIIQEDGHTATYTNSSKDLSTQLNNQFSLVITHLDSLEDIKNILCPSVIAMPPEQRPYILIICEPEKRKSVILTLGILMGDYLLTPVDKFEVKSKIKFASEILQSYNAVIKNTSPFSTNSIFDPFLGILNQQTILEVLNNEINRIKRNEDQLSIVVLKINQIEQIYQKYGIYEKLKTLRYISQIIKVNIRLSDKIGAWHDDQFLLILPGCGYMHIEAVLERISRVAQSLPINFFDHDILHLNISANAVHYTKSTKTPAFLLVKQASQDLKLISVD